MVPNPFVSLFWRTIKGLFFEGTNFSPLKLRNLHILLYFKNFVCLWLTINLEFQSLFVLSSLILSKTLMICKVFWKIKESSLRASWHLNPPNFSSQIHFPRQQSPASLHSLSFHSKSAQCFPPKEVEKCHQEKWLLVGIHLKKFLKKTFFCLISTWVWHLLLIKFFYQSIYVYVKFVLTKTSFEFW